MIIKKVEIENFFCFINPAPFEFGEGLNIISAKNSGGKSHLFNAFHWTFFNNVYVDKEQDSTKKEWKSADKVVTIPDNIAFNANVDDVLSTKIAITLNARHHEGDEDSDDDLVDYHFEKVMKFKKLENGIIPISTPELQIWYVYDGETYYLQKGEHNWFLDALFPVSIRKFMWFQGETVDELYDFNNPSTLNYAIKEISYFPIYENLVSITKESQYSISKKIDNELRKRKNLTTKQETLIREIEEAKRKISNYNDKIIDCKNEIENLTETIYNEEDKLKGFDKFSELKSKITKFDYEIKSVNDKIESLSVFGKEKFVSKWMLNKCDDLIKASSKNLDLLSAEVKAFQPTDNPVPITLPGPEYVQQMLDNHICYICEREVVEGTPAYAALETRMADFKANQIQKIQSDNFTELNRFRRSLLNELPTITNEINEHDNQIEKLLEQRKKLLKQKDRLFTDSGIEDNDLIITGSTTAEQILNKLRSLNSSKSSAEKRLINLENDKMAEDSNLSSLLDKKTKEFQTSPESEDIVEIKAKKYIDVIAEIVERLKNKALKELLEEITIESNLLYGKYLGGNTQGEIVVDKGIRVVDKKTKRQLTNLNTAEITAQKLAVANAFLSLSEKKMNRSFPLLADAPTSDFDDDNTLFLTENLTGSFKQIIVMSKDYNKLLENQREEFIERANIVRYYELKNDLIDKEGDDSRTNKKTYVNCIK
jgi:hypothetical protein